MVSLACTALIGLINKEKELNAQAEGATGEKKLKIRKRQRRVIAFARRFAGRIDVERLTCEELAVLESELETAGVQ